MAYDGCFLPHFNGQRAILETSLYYLSFGCDNRPAIMSCKPICSWTVVFYAFLRLCRDDRGLRTLGASAGDFWQLEEVFVHGID